MDDPGKLMQHLIAVEEVAEEILAEKQQIVDLDNKRQKTREAIRAVQKDPSNKTWVCFGNMFIKLPKNNTTKLLNKDYNNLDKEIDDIRANLKPKVNKLRDYEHKEGLKGFHLNPLSKKEIQAISNVL